MTLDDAIASIRDNLGFHDNLEQATIVRTMDRVKGFYEGENGVFPIPGFLFDPTWETTTQLTTNIITMPAEFIQLDPEWDVVLRHPDDPKPLTPVPWDKVPPVGSPAVPTHYVFDGFRLYLYPAPDDEYIVQVPHYRKSGSFTAGTNPWLDYFPNLIIWEATNALAAAARDQMALREAEKQLPGLRQTHFTQMEATRHLHRSYTMGPK